MEGKYIAGIAAILVAVILVGSVLAPIINTTGTTEIKVDNDGAVGLRMEKITTGNFTITFDEVDGEFTATNGSDAQIIDDVCIFYADNNVAVWLDDSSVRMVGVDADDKTFNAVLSDSAAITITKSSEGVNITDGTVDKTFPVPSWSFVPKSTGAYGFFLNETEVNTAGMDTLFVGSFAGVDCYNGINTFDLPIILDKTLSNNTLSGAKWVRASADPEELNPDDLNITPLDPGIITIDPEPDVSVMAIPTPTYTEGDWGYDVSGGVATIVSYSGIGGDIVTVPSSIGGYDVSSLGADNNNSWVFDNTIVINHLIISDGITTINGGAFRGNPTISQITFPNTLTSIKGYAFYHATNVTGQLNLPEGLTTIGDNVFRYSGFTGSLVIPETVTGVLAGSLFQYSSFDGAFVVKSSNVILGASVIENTRITSLVTMNGDETNYRSGTFSNTSYLKEVLNLTTVELTTTSYGLNADEVRSDVPALGYIAAMSYTDTTEGPMSAMFAVIPLIMVIAILMFAVGFAIYRRME